MAVSCTCLIVNIIIITDVLAMQPSLQQVMFPLSKPLRIQNDQGEILKDQPLKVGGKITSEEHVSVPVSSSSITSYSEHNPAFKLPFKRKKVL